MELDFSKLENIAYRGFNGAEERAKKDALIEQRLYRHRRRYNAI